jgi:hypothetical protein
VRRSVWLGRERPGMRVPFQHAEPDANASSQPLTVAEPHRVAEHGAEPNAITEGKRFAPIGS